MLNNEQQPCVTILKVGESKEQVDEFITNIVTHMKQMGVAYQKNVKKNVKINENEVTKSSIAKMDIQMILTHINDYERAINDGDLNIATIQTLTTLY